MIQLYPPRSATASPVRSALNGPANRRIPAYMSGNGLPRSLSRITEAPDAAPARI